MQILVCLVYALVFSAQCSACTGLEKIEKRYGITVGFYAIDTNNGHIFSHREDERFPLQSTVKMLVAAAALKHMDVRQQINISPDDLVFWSPVTRRYLDSGYMTIEALAEAAMRYSDNAATNILIDRLGGVDKVNTFAKALGNASFNLENIEPYLHSSFSSIQDTSTPKDMARSVQALLLDERILDNAKQQQFKMWMLHNTTGDAKIRAGLPAGWYAAEKTGGSTSVSNDIGIIWSSACKPIVLAIYTISNTENSRIHPDAVKWVTDLVFSELSKSNACFTAREVK